MTALVLKGRANSTRFWRWGVCGLGMSAKHVNKRKTRRSTPPPEAKSPVDRVIRAVDAFRRGLPVLIEDKRTALLAFAVETTRQAELDKAIAKRATARLVLTHARARTLKIRLYTPDVVALAIAPATPIGMLRAIADPTEDLAYPLKGPFDALREKLG